MEIKNCKICGRLFNYIGGSMICPACEKKLEEKYQQVKEYIYDNPKVPIALVAEENDVTVNQIKKWVREERLCFSDDSPIGLQCESCGKIIKTGRFCKECKGKMVNNLDKALDKPKEVTVKKETRENGRMRFL